MLSRMTHHEWTTVWRKREVRNAMQQLWEKLARQGYPETALQVTGDLQKQRVNGQLTYRLPLMAISTTENYVDYLSEVNGHWRVNLSRTDDEPQATH